jgi:hypothetical protein
MSEPDIETLRLRHRELDDMIEAAATRPSSDAIELKRLKLERLRLKDHIERRSNRN